MMADGVHVSQEEIYRAVLAVGSEVRGLVQRADMLQETIRDHEARIRDTEKSRWPTHLVSILVTLVMGLFTIANYYTK